MKRRLFPQLAGILFLLVLGSSVISAQLSQGHLIKVEVPEVLHMEVGEGEIAFNLSTPNAGEQYPPVSYPAYYTPTSDRKYASIKVYSNYAQDWMLMIYGQADFGAAPTIEWSLNGEEWYPLEAGGQMLTKGGFTSGWSEIKVYYRLVIDGSEYGGEEYKVNVFYNLTAM
ncbi:MAG: hypothetical protein GX050_07005 [Firmicutes bacterium]|nr:hypothetical protein [Bacillota bacterium]